MTSIHRKLKLAFIFPDGDTGHVLKVTTQDGEMLDMPLTVENCLTLAEQAAKAARRMLDPLQLAQARRR